MSKVFGPTIVIAAVATFGVVTWWAMRDPAPVDGAVDAGILQRGGEDAQPAQSQWPSAVVSSTDSTDDDVSAPGVDADAAASSASFVAYVSGKYRYLPQSPRLTAALLERERIAVAINTAKQSADPDEKQKMPQLQAELAEADRKVGGLLAAADVAGYEVLKNSDVDQFQFEDYVGGISNVAPLADEKKQAILYAKLTNRYRFNQVLENSGFMRGDLTPSQRQNALDDVTRALRESRDGFLQEARQHMHDEEQFTLLSNYENTEYSGELDKLRRIADRGSDGRAEGG
jgi:hypothetical protein